MISDFNEMLFWNAVIDIRATWLRYICNFSSTCTRIPGYVLIYRFLFIHARLKSTNRVFVVGIPPTAHSTVSSYVWLLCKNWTAMPFLGTRVVLAVKYVSTKNLLNRWSDQVWNRYVYIYIYAYIIWLALLKQVLSNIASCYEFSVKCEICFHKSYLKQLL